MTTRASHKLTSRVKILPANSRLRELIKEVGNVGFSFNKVIRYTKFKGEYGRVVWFNVVRDNKMIRIDTEVRVEHVVPLEVL